jgi:hypothetical protein
LSISSQLSIQVKKIPNLSRQVKKILCLGCLVFYLSDLSAQIGPIDFSTRYFPKEFDSSNVTFAHSCFFYFYDTARHVRNRSYFPTTASFRNDAFKKKVACNDISFSNDVSFHHSSFYNTADFSRDTFNSNAIFDSARFLNDCHFVLANFQNSADFSNAIFSKTAYFSSINLTDTTDLDFTNAILPDTLDFSDISPIPIEINLSKASEDSNKKGPKHCIYLAGSDISKFSLDYKYYKLLFCDPQTKREMPYDQKDAVYEGLLKNFDHRGQLESYRLLDIEFHDYQWSKKGLPMRWFYVIPHYWNYYGYENELIFLWAAGFLLLFTFISYFHLDHFINNVYPMDNVKDFKSRKEIKDTPIKKDRNHQFWLRVWNAFIYTSVIFFSFSLSVDKFKFQYRKASFFLIVVFTIGIVCIAYMANFVISK